MIHFKMKRGTLDTLLVNLRYWLVEEGILEHIEGIEIVEDERGGAVATFSGRLAVPLSALPASIEILGVTHV